MLFVCRVCSWMTSKFGWAVVKLRSSVYIMSSAQNCQRTNLIGLHSLRSERMLLQLFFFFFIMNHFSKGVFYVILFPFFMTKYILQQYFDWLNKSSLSLSSFPLRSTFSLLAISYPLQSWSGWFRETRIGVSILPSLFLDPRVLPGCSSKSNPFAKVKNHFNNLVGCLRVRSQFFQVKHN